ncbi:MAG: transglycosylase SLT domain-containing protein [Candidatus Caenarcaniphilales bacterium]|nr:transglycosylase SLT domain-containing protein [Candidatus Caenarcaniphilales bacterium]
MSNIAKLKLSTDHLPTEPSQTKEASIESKGFGFPDIQTIFNNFLVIAGLVMLIGSLYFAYDRYLILPVERPPIQSFKPFQPKAAFASALAALPVNRASAADQLAVLRESSSPRAEARRLYVLAVLKQNSGDLPEALKLFQRINLRHLPYLADRVLIHKAEIGAENGDEKLVIDSCQQILRTFADSLSVPQAYYELGRSHLRQGQKEQASQEFQYLRAYHPKSHYGQGALYYLGELNEVITQRNAFWEEYLRLSPKGRFSPEIIRVWDSPGGFDSLSGSQRATLGMVYYLNGKADLAYSLLDQYRQPGDYLALAQLQLKKELRLEAIQTLMNGLKQNPEDPRFNEGVSLLLQNGSKDENEFRLIQLAQTIPSKAAYLSWRRASLATGIKRKQILQEMLSDYPTNLWSSEASVELFWEAFKSQDWAQVRERGQTHIALFPRHYTTTRVKYWLGKLAELQSDRSSAVVYYQDLLKQGPVTYYYFRAGQRLEALYKGEDPGWKVGNGNLSPDAQKILKSQPEFPLPSGDIQKQHPTARELFALNLWQEALSLLPPDFEKTYPLLNAWAIARVQENPIEGIKVAARELSKAKPTLETERDSWLLAYPLLYGDYVLEHCPNHQVDPLLLLGLIRQESRFDHTAISRSKAVGLCQLMPQTAKEVARQVGLTEPNTALLTTPNYNIKLGSKYLGDMLHKFEGKPYLAIAAYNAGPGNAGKWAQNASYGMLVDHYDTDYFIEQIPFAETQKYVVNVFENYWVYLALSKQNTFASRERDHTSVE